jgi:hypothetical protein
LGASFGVGGGIVIVPLLVLVLVLVLALDPRRASVTSLATILISSARRRCGGGAAATLRRAADRHRRTDRLAGAAQIVNTSGMPESEDIWIPLVDEPIGSIVAQIQADHPEIDALIASPRKILAFRTFAYIRVGLLLGQLLVDSDVPSDDRTETWIEALLRDSKHEDAVVAEVRAVAEEVAADPRYADEEPIGPDDEARNRFREFAKKQLG